MPLFWCRGCGREVVMPAIADPDCCGRMMARDDYGEHAACASCRARGKETCDCARRTLALRSRPPVAPWMIER